MNIRKIIQEELGDFDWVGDINSAVTISDITPVPGHRYHIVDLPYSEYEYYYSDRDMKEYDIYNTEFCY